jgi:hypothetical protein
MRPQVQGFFSSSLLPTWPGFVYLAVVLDAYSSRSSAGLWLRPSPPGWCRVRPSMDSVGDVYANTMCASFFPAKDAGRRDLQGGR